MMHHRKALGGLLALLLLSLTGCDIFTGFQSRIFDNDSLILKSWDSYTFAFRSGKSSHTDSEIRFSSFTGMETLLKFNVKERENPILRYVSEVSEGEFKTVLLTPEEEVIELFSQSAKGTASQFLNPGEYRIKIVGRKAKGELHLNLIRE